MTNLWMAMIFLLHAASGNNQLRYFCDEVRDAAFYTCNMNPPPHITHFHIGNKLKVESLFLRNWKSTYTLSISLNAKVQNIFLIGGEISCANILHSAHVTIHGCIESNTTNNISLATPTTNYHTITVIVKETTNFISSKASYLSTEETTVLQQHSSTTSWTSTQEKPSTFTPPTGTSSETDHYSTHSTLFNHEPTTPAPTSAPTSTDHISKPGEIESDLKAIFVAVGSAGGVVLVLLIIGVCCYRGRRRRVLNRNLSVHSMESVEEFDITTLEMQRRKSE